MHFHGAVIQEWVREDTYKGTNSFINSFIEWIIKKNLRACEGKIKQFDFFKAFDWWSFICLHPDIIIMMYP